MSFNRCPFFHRQNLDEFFTPFPSSLFLTEDPIFESIMPKAMVDRRRGAFQSPALHDFPSLSSLAFSKGYDIREFQDKYQIQVDVPGIKASDINVELEHDGRVLHISGRRKRETKDEHGNVSFSESSRFDKRFTVGDNVEMDKMSGNLANGVLTLVAPKKMQDEKKVTKIPITEDTKKTPLGRLTIQSKM